MECSAILSFFYLLQDDCTYIYMYTLLYVILPGYTTKVGVSPCFCALNSSNSWYACYFFKIFFPGGESLEIWLRKISTLPGRRT